MGTTGIGESGLMNSSLAKFNVIEEIAEPFQSIRAPMEPIYSQNYPLNAVQQPPVNNGFQMVPVQEVEMVPAQQMEMVPVNDVVQVQQAVPVEQVVPVEQQYQLQQMVPVEQRVHVQQMVPLQQIVPVHQMVPAEQIIPYQQAVIPLGQPAVVQSQITQVGELPVI